MDAYLVGADLRGAYLVGAYLMDAYLVGAYLMDADLGGANLRGAPLKKNAICISGFPYKVTIFDETAQIGCQTETIAEWLRCEREDFLPYRDAFKAVVLASGRMPAEKASA